MGNMWKDTDGDKRGNALLKEICGKITVERANEIQEKWMNLSCNASKEEQQAVFDEMKLLPKSHFSISRDGKTASIIHNGTPLCMAMPVKDCMKSSGASYVKTDLAWNESKWIRFDKYAY